MKNRMRKVQVIAFVLSVLILLNIPLPVLAQAAVENAIEEAQNQPVLMTDKLTETETYWQNADGSITYEQHLEPIRYQDEEGNWKDIVNDVVQVDKSTDSQDPFKEEAYDYRSESSKNWVLFKDSMFDAKRGSRCIHSTGTNAAPANGNTGSNAGAVLNAGCHTIRTADGDTAACPGKRYTAGNTAAHG